MCFARNFGTLPYNEVADIRCLMSGDSYYSSNYLQSNRHDTSKKQTDDNPHAARQCVKDERFCAATRPGGGRGEGLAPVKVPIVAGRHRRLENDTVMNFIPIPTELKVDKVNIMLIKS